MSTKIILSFKFFSITSSSSTILKKTSDLCKKMCKNVWLRLASSRFTVTSSRRKSFHFFRSSKSTNMLDRSSPLGKDRRRLDKSSLAFFKSNNFSKPKIVSICDTLNSSFIISKVIFTAGGLSIYSQWL